MASSLTQPETENDVDEKGNNNEKIHQPPPAGAQIQLFDMLEYNFDGVINDIRNRRSYFEMINYWIEQCGGLVTENPYGRLYIRCQLAKLISRGISAVISQDCDDGGDNDDDGKDDDVAPSPFFTYDSNQWEEFISDFKNIKSLLTRKDATSFIYIHNNTPPPPTPSDDADDVTVEPPMTILDEDHTIDTERSKLPIFTDSYKIMKREFVLQQALSYLRVCCGKTDGDDAERPKDDNAPFPWKDAMDYSDHINKYFKDDAILPTLRSIIVKPPNDDSDPLDERSWCIASTTKLKELLNRPEFSVRFFCICLMSLVTKWDRTLPLPRLVQCGYGRAKDDSRRRREAEDDVTVEEGQQRPLGERRAEERTNMKNNTSPTARQGSPRNKNRPEREIPTSPRQSARLRDTREKLLSRVVDPLPDALKQSERVRNASISDEELQKREEAALLESIEKKTQDDDEPRSSRSNSRYPSRRRNDDTTKNKDKENNSDSNTQTEPPSPLETRRSKRDRNPPSFTNNLLAPKRSARQVDFSDTEDDSSERVSLSSLPKRQRIRVTARTLHPGSPTGSITSTLSSNRRRGRKFWTHEEKEAVIQGLTQYGPGNWKQIKELNKEALKDRNPMQIKDCFRTMLKRGDLPWSDR